MISKNDAWTDDSVNNEGVKMDFPGWASPRDRQVNISGKTFQGL